MSLATIRKSRPDKNLWRRQVEIRELEDFYETIGCRVCGSTDNLTIDHVIPKALRGQNIFSNKQVLCEFHNQLKGDLPPGDNGWWPNSLMHLIGN